MQDQETSTASTIQAAPERIAVRRMLHTIHAVRDCDPVRRRYEDIFGAVVFAERYHEGEDRDMALFYVADHMIEPMAPRRPDTPDTTFSQYLAKFGESLHSFELRIDDAPAAARACERHGMQLSTVYPLFFFVKPRSTGGIVVQMCGKPLVNDLKDYRNWNPDWIEGHPSTLRRLRHVACYVRNLDAALYFFTQVLTGSIVEDGHVPAPQPGRRTIVCLGDTNVALFKADDPSVGPVGDYFSTPRSGIHSLVWEVDNLSVAEAYLRSLGVETEPAEFDAGGIAIPPSQMFGARHEFMPSARKP
jgi:catechol 2,3-dioxygenase-like lactoylglutathione lyase family enzyme